jgi:hypothetical protein
VLLPRLVHQPEQLVVATLLVEQPRFLAQVCEHHEVGQHGIGEPHEVVLVGEAGTDHEGVAER